MQSPECDKFHLPIDSFFLEIEIHVYVLSIGMLCLRSLEVHTFEAFDAFIAKHDINLKNRKSHELCNLYWRPTNIKC